jgi:hypothetical protein
LKATSILFALALSLLCSLPAQARGFVLFNTGNELFEVAAFPQKLTDEDQELRNVKAGYKCDRFGIFWADVWTWNCQLVAVTGEDSYADLPAAIVTTLAADPDYSMKQAKRSFWNLYGFWSLIGAAIGASLLVWRIAD